MAGDYPGAVANLVHFYESVRRLNLDVDQVVPIHGRLTTWGEIRQSVQTYGNTMNRGTYREERQWPTRFQTGVRTKRLPTVLKQDD